jgi:hypothetical protein
MLATDVADARGRSLAIAAVMSFSKFSAGYTADLGEGLRQASEERRVTLRLFATHSPGNHAVRANTDVPREVLQCGIEDFNIEAGFVD